MHQITLTLRRNAMTSCTIQYSSDPCWTDLGLQPDKLITLINELYMTNSTLDRGSMFPLKYNRFIYLCIIRPVWNPALRLRYEIPVVSLLSKIFHKILDSPYIVSNQSIHYYINFPYVASLDLSKYIHDKLQNNTQLFPVLIPYNLP